MKVIFNCVFNELLEDHCQSIHRELKNRGHESIISEPSSTLTPLQSSVFDITIQPDECCIKLGTKIGVFICHGFDAKGLLIRDDVHKHLKLNSDYLFLYSDAYRPLLEDLKIPMFTVGMAKLDKCFKTRKNKTFNTKNPVIFYAPTQCITTNFDLAIQYHKLKTKFKIFTKHHPATTDSEKISTTDILNKVDIVITDHSSIGIEAIVLGIPTIMSSINDYNLSIDYPTMKVKKAAILVNNYEQTVNAINTYINNPMYLKEDREYLGQYICANQGNSTKIIVDTLERIYGSLY